MAKKQKVSATATPDANAEANVKPSHFKNGHNWLAWITGMTAVWMIITFICGLMGDCDLPRSLKFMNCWYLTNICAIILISLYATFAVIKKCPSLVFWTSTLFFVMTLQAVSLVILYFYQEDSATINALVMFVWSIAWYGYLMTGEGVESDYPSVHRSHNMVGTVVLALMTLSTIAYGFMVVIKLLW